MFKFTICFEFGNIMFCRLYNDLYPLPGETFRLYYKSLCTDQQTIDIYIVDSFNQTVTKSFSFNNETEEEGGDDGAEPDLPY